MAADGVSPLHDINNLTLDLKTAVSALVPNEGGAQFYLLAGAGDNTLTGLHAQVGTTNYSYADLDSTAGNDTINGEPISGNFTQVRSVDYNDAPSAVQVNLQTGVVTGGSGNDTIHNVSSVQGSNFDDTLIGDGNTNNLLGEGGNDHLYGLGGDDFLTSGSGNDTLDGGDGNDWAIYNFFDNGTVNSGVTVSLAVSGPQDTGSMGVDTLVDIENLEGTQFNDTLTGNSGANILKGDGGADTFVFTNLADSLVTQLDTVTDFTSGGSGGRSFRHRPRLGRLDHRIDPRGHRGPGKRSCRGAGQHQLRGERGGRGDHQWRHRRRHLCRH